MSTDEEYRRQAASAEKQASSARNDADREAWLRIAQGWMILIRRRSQTADDFFDAQDKADRRGQEDSKSSN